MKKTLLSAVFTACALLAGQAFAADAACDAKATEKKLAGAAKTSFLKKCEKDSAAAMGNATCDKTAAEKKLAGAAKNSFVKKCMADAKKAA